MLDGHDSQQLYDIVNFEHKLSWFCFKFPQKVSPQREEYYLIINRSFPKLVDVRLSSSNTSPRTKYTSPYISWCENLSSSGVFCWTFENLPIGTIKFRAWLRQYSLIINTWLFPYWCGIFIQQIYLDRKYFNINIKKLMLILKLHEYFFKHDTRSKTIFK